jgi:hypothetical protein
MVPTVSLSFLNRGKVKQVCRVCHELAELKTERLCGDCARIKAQILVRFAEAACGTIAIPAEQHCHRAGCSCAACDGRTVDPHQFYVFDLARAERREIHFHPRCHELWVEAVTALVAHPDQSIDIGQG